MGAGWGWRPHAARNVAVPTSQRHTARGQHELKVGAWAHSGGQFPIFVAEQDGEEPADAEACCPFPENGEPLDLLDHGPDVFPRSKRRIDAADVADVVCRVSL